MAMIDLLKEFNSACEDLVRFQDVVRQTLAKVEDAALKEHLQQADREIEQALTEARVVFPQATAELDADLAETQKTIDETQKQIAEVEKTLDEAEAQPENVVPPPAPPAPLDGNRWETLRRELIDRFGPPPTVVAAVADDAGEVVDMTSGNFQSMVQPNPVAPPVAPSKQTHKPTDAPPKKPGKPSQPPDDDMLDMTSGEWNTDDK
jgi:hypothetical protein